MIKKLAGATFFAVMFAAVSAQADMDTQRSAAAAATDRERGTVRGDDPTASKGPHMSTSVSRTLKALFDATKKGDWDTAKGKLVEVRAISTATDFDKFEIEVAGAYVALNSKPKDDAAALASYKLVIASPFFATALSKTEQGGTLRNAMVLSNAAGDYDNAISFGGKLAAAGAMDENSAIALATAYYGKGNYAAARDLAQKAIDAEAAAGKPADPTATQIVAQSKAKLGS